MARYIGPKFRLDRREGTNLLLKGKRSVGGKHPIDKKGAIPPGQHGARRARKLSGYGVQLREKQKAKRMYGLLEKQFRSYYTKAMRTGEKGEGLLRLLERRLDNVVYRLGLAVSRAQARQLVTHGHVLVDNKKMTIPSYFVKEGQVVTIKLKSQAMPGIQEGMELAQGIKMPQWLERKALVGKILRMPVREDMPLEINENLIVEFYSR